VFKGERGKKSRGHVASRWQGGVRSWGKDGGEGEGRSVGGRREERFPWAEAGSGGVPAAERGVEGGEGW